MNGIGFEIIRNAQIYVIGIVGFVFVGGAVMIGLLILRDKIKAKFKK